MDPAGTPASWALSLNVRMHNMQRRLRYRLQFTVSTTPQRTHTLLGSICLYAYAMTLPQYLYPACLRQRCIR